MLDNLQIWIAKRATCANVSCPVPYSVRKKKCTLFEIGSSIRSSTFDVVEPDFLGDKKIQKKVKKEHCLKVVPTIKGWKSAKYNEESGEIDRF